MDCRLATRLILQLIVELVAELLLEELGLCLRSNAVMESRSCDHVVGRDVCDSQLPLCVVAHEGCCQ